MLTLTDAVKVALGRGNGQWGVATEGSSGQAWEADVSTSHCVEEGGYGGTAHGGM